MKTRRWTIAAALILPPIAFGYAVVIPPYLGVGQYRIHRPDILPGVSEFTEVLSITAITYPSADEKSSLPTTRFVEDTLYSGVAIPYSEAMERYEKASYGFEEQRILYALKDMGILPEKTMRLGEESLDRLYGYVQKTGQIDDGSIYASRLSGIVVEALGRGNERYLFVGVRGGAVNDTYHYHEFLFEVPEDGSDPTCLDSLRLYFDEWGEYAWAIFGAVLGGMGTAICSSFALAIWVLRVGWRRLNHVGTRRKRESDWWN